MYVPCESLLATRHYDAFRVPLCFVLYCKEQRGAHSILKKCLKVSFCLLVKICVAFFRDTTNRVGDSGRSCCDLRRIFGSYTSARCFLTTHDDDTTKISRIRRKFNCLCLVLHGFMMTPFAANAEKCGFCGNEPELYIYFS